MIKENEVYKFTLNDGYYLIVEIFEVRENGDSMGTATVIASKDGNFIGKGINVWKSDIKRYEHLPLYNSPLYRAMEE